MFQTFRPSSEHVFSPELNAVFDRLCFGAHGNKYIAQGDNLTQRALASPGIKPKIVLASLIW